MGSVPHRQNNHWYSYQVVRCLSLYQTTTWQCHTSITNLPSPGTATIPGTLLLLPGSRYHYLVWYRNPMNGSSGMSSLPAFYSTSNSTRQYHELVHKRAVVRGGTEIIIIRNCQETQGSGPFNQASPLLFPLLLLLLLPGTVPGSQQTATKLLRVIHLNFIPVPEFCTLRPTVVPYIFLLRAWYYTLVSRIILELDRTLPNGQNLSFVCFSKRSHFRGIPLIH